MISSRELIQKRGFDLFLSILLLPILIVPIALLVFIATADVKSFGLFRQVRIGQHGQPFTIYKIKSMPNARETPTRFGRFLRGKKLDELTQLFNVLNGTMSFVGPRPDVLGFADQLVGDDRIILKVKPGITGPATLRFVDEEAVLSQHSEPDRFNREVIWKEKVEINRNYVENYSFYLDLQILVKTIRMVFGI